MKKLILISITLIAIELLIYGYVSFLGMGNGSYEMKLKLEVMSFLENVFGWPIRWFNNELPYLKKIKNRESLFLFYVALNALMQAIILVSLYYGLSRSFKIIADKISR